MSPKTRRIIGWVLTALLAALFIWSAAMKFISSGPETEKMLAGMGLTADDMHILGAVEALATVLFIVPRTGIVGTLLLAGYLGGAIATHLEHGQPVWMPVGISALLWIAAALRFPELTSRLFSGSERQ